NLPVDAVRSMDVDVLIVVDVSFPLLPQKRLNSPLQITNQMLAILIRRQTARQLATLGERDILISPALGDTSSANFSVVQETIDKGESAARTMAPRLADLGLDKAQFAQWIASRRAVREGPPPRVEFITVDERSRRYV